MTRIATTAGLDRRSGGGARARDRDRPNANAETASSYEQVRTDQVEPDRSHCAWVPAATSRRSGRGRPYRGEGGVRDRSAQIEVGDDWREIRDREPVAVRQGLTGDETFSRSLRVVLAVAS